MANNIIATWQDAKDKGFSIPSTYNLSQCPSKQKLTDAGVSLTSSADNYGNNRLIPYDFISDPLKGFRFSGAIDYLITLNTQIYLDGELVSPNIPPTDFGAYPQVASMYGILEYPEDGSIYLSTTSASQLEFQYPANKIPTRLNGSVYWLFLDTGGPQGTFQYANIQIKYRALISDNTWVNGDLDRGFEVGPESLIEIYVDADLNAIANSSRVLEYRLIPQYNILYLSESQSYSSRSIETKENTPSSIPIPKNLSEPEIYEYNDPSLGLKFTVKVRHKSEYQNLES